MLVTTLGATYFMSRLASHWDSVSIHAMDNGAITDVSLDVSRSEFLRIEWAGVTQCKVTLATGVSISRGLSPACELGIGLRWSCLMPRNRRTLSGERRMGHSGKRPDR